MENKEGLPEVPFHTDRKRNLSLISTNAKVLLNNVLELEVCSVDLINKHVPYQETATHVLCKREDDRILFYGQIFIDSKNRHIWACMRNVLCAYNITKDRWVAQAEEAYINVQSLIFMKDGKQEVFVAQPGSFMSRTEKTDWLFNSVRVFTFLSTEERIRLLRNCTVYRNRKNVS